MRQSVIAHIELGGTIISVPYERSALAERHFRFGLLETVIDRNFAEVDLVRGHLVACSHCIGNES